MNFWKNVLDENYCRKGNFLREYPFLKNIFISAILLLVVFVIYFPHIKYKMVSTLDAPFHLMRIKSVAVNIQNGHPFRKIHHYSGYGYGIGTGFGYPNIFIYASSILYLLLGEGENSLLIAFKFNILLALIALAFSVYYANYLLTKNTLGALSSAAFVLLSNPIGKNIYFQCMLGVLVASPFMPLAIVGLYLWLLNKEKSRLLELGFIGLIMSNTLSAFCTFIVCLLLFFIIIPKVKSKWKLIVEGCMAVGWVIAITTSYWWPLLEQLRAQTLKLSIPLHIAYDSVPYISEMWSNGKRGLGVLPFLLISVFVVWDILKKNKKNICWYILSVFLLVLIYCKPLYYFVNYILGFHIIQFPERFLLPLIIVLSFALCNSISQNTQYSQAVSCGIIVLGMCLNCIFILYPYVYTDDYVIYNVEQRMVAGAGAGEEWVPLNADLSGLQQSDEAFDILETSIEGYKMEGDSIFRFVVKDAKSQYMIPFFWYKGYVAYTQDGMRLNIEQDNQTGLLRVILPDELLGKGVEISVFYKSTKRMILSYVISVFSLIFYIYINYLKKIKVHQLGSRL